MFTATFTLKPLRQYHCKWQSLGTQIEPRTKYNDCRLLIVCPVPNTSTSYHLIIVWSCNKSSSYLTLICFFSNQQPELNTRRLGEDALASLPQTQTCHPNPNNPVIQQDTLDWNLTQLHQYLENQILKVLRKNPDTLNKLDKRKTPIQKNEQ